MELLKRLVETDGLPGFEGDVRDLIVGEIADYVDRYWVDRTGNLFAVKNEGAVGRKIAASAHTDEVGLVVKGVNGDGTLAFDSWGIDASVLGAKAVAVGKDRIRGVVGVRDGLGDEPTKMGNLFIDIGCSKKDEAEKLVSVGDFVAYAGDYTEFGLNNTKIRAKALDDRVGCYILIQLLKSGYKGQITAVFCAQEEVGTRGSRVASRSVEAELFFNLEGTICLDVFDVEPRFRVTEQGKGAALYLTDAGSMYNIEYVRSIAKMADERGIAYQYRKTRAGGTDSANYHVGRGGACVIGIGVPCRYIHSGVSVADKRDIESGVALVLNYAEKYYAEGV